MECPHENSARVGVRGRRIWIPTRPLQAGRAVILGGGIIVTWVTTGVILSLVDELLFGGSPDDNWLLLLFWLVSAAAPVGWTLFYAREDHETVMRPTAGRTQRLAKLAGERKTLRRLPHRLLEQALRTFGFSEARMKQVFRQIAPGELVVVDGVRILDSPRPGPQ